MKRLPRTHSSVGIPHGQQRKANPFLSIGGLYQCSGMHFDEPGSITKWKGFSKTINGFVMSQLLESAVAAKFTGLFDYTKSDQTKIAIAAALSDIYKQNSGTWQSIKSGQTGTVNDLYDFFVLKDVLYMCNGVNGNLKYDGTNVWNMGIAAPGSAPTAASGGAGVLTGAYSYKVTFYNSTLGHESNPSAASNTFTAASNQINLTGIPTSADTQVNQRRLYRTTTGGGVWQFLATISDNTTTTYTDNNADSALGTAVEATGNGVPPTVAMFAVYKGFVFMVAKNSSRVWFSRQNAPNAVDSNDFRDLDADDGDVVTGIKRLYDYVVAFKNDSIWNGSGTDRNSMQFTRQAGGIGSVNHKGIVLVPGLGMLMFPSEDGFYSYNGVNEKKESSEIDSVYRGLNQSRLKYIVGDVYKPLNLCYWLASDGSSSENDLMITYDYQKGEWATRPLSVKGNVTAIIEDSSNNEIFYVGSYDGYVRQGDTGYSDDGSALTATVIDRPWPKGNDSDTIKAFSEMLIYFKPQSGTTLSVSYAIDDPDGTYTSIGTADLSASSGVARMTFDAQGRRLYPKFVNAQTGQPCVIRGWYVESIDTGRSY